MLEGKFSGKIGTSGQVILINFILICNAFVWYFYAFDTLKQIVSPPSLATFESPMVVASLTSTAISALVGATCFGRFRRKFSFLLLWMVFGFLSSLAPILLYQVTMTNILIVSTLLGISFGFGMPACMAYYADSTAIENRAKLGGLIFFSIGLGYFLFGMMAVTDIWARVVVLAVWRGLGLMILLLLKPTQEVSEKSLDISYSYVMQSRSFILYFVPWCMFCMINYTNVPVADKLFSQEFIRGAALIEGVFAGLFSIIGGFLSDIVGRKRVVITGFVMLGLGYAVLGLFPGDFSQYLYIVVDGAAWGVFHTLFLLTLWGDIAYGAPSERFYALGGLPFLTSYFLQLVMNHFLDRIPNFEQYARSLIFPLASFFLFLAVIPLMYAPETLPKKKIIERELKQYIEKAKKIKDKYA